MAVLTRMGVLGTYLETPVPVRVVALVTNVGVVGVQGVGFYGVGRVEFGE